MVYTHLSSRLILASSITEDDLKDIEFSHLILIVQEEEIPSYEFIKCYNRFVLNLSIEEREILIEKVKESYAFIEEMSKDDICLILGDPNSKYTQNICIFFLMTHNKLNKEDAIRTITDCLPKFSTKNDDTPKKLYYTCRICRFNLFEDEDIVSHNKSKHKFSHHKLKGEYSKKDTCTSYFINDKPWMTGLHELSGKISCPKCDSTLGKWKWDGTQCSCGTWCTPAFQILKNRVDVKFAN